MGHTLPLTKQRDGTYDLDLSQIPHGRLDEIANIRGPADRVWDKWVNSSTGGAYAALKRLEGMYSAHDWCERHELTINRALRKRFDPREFEGRLLELKNTPTKLRHLVLDLREDPLVKRARVIKHIATEESEITGVFGKRGSGKSVTTADVLYACRYEHGRNIATLDTRPKDKLPHFVRRIVDLRQADPEELVWVDEAAKRFAHRKSMHRSSQGLGAILATARHRGLGILALAPTGGIVDKLFEILGDAMLLKPSTLNQQTSARAGEARLHYEFPEMIPTTREWSLFVSYNMAPTTFVQPYVCGQRAGPTHRHEWKCCIPEFWTLDMSKSQMAVNVLIHENESYQELAHELCYWDMHIEDIADVMGENGCVYPPDFWAKWLSQSLGGIHPRTGEPLDFGPYYHVNLPEGALGARRRPKRNLADKVQDAHEKQRAELDALRKTGPRRVGETAG